MDKEELKERVAECLRSLDVGESMSVESIAEEIGEPLSDVNMAVDSMLTERLLFQDGMIGKRTYSLSGKGKHYGTAVTRPKNALPEVKDEFPEAPSEGGEALALSHKEKGYEELTKNEAECTCQYCGTVLSSPGRKKNHEPVCGKNPNRNEGCGKRTGKAVERMIKRKETIARKYPGEPRPKDTTELPADLPEADDPRQCRWCGQRLCNKKYREKHEDKCPKNPKNARPAKKEGINIPKPALPKKLGNVPAPSEYAGNDEAAAAPSASVSAGLNIVNARPVTTIKGPFTIKEGGLITQTKDMVMEGGLHLDSPAPQDHLKEVREAARSPAECADDEEAASYHATPTNPLSATTVEERERLESAPAKTPMATAAEVAEAESIRDELRKEITLRMHVVIDPAPGTLRLLKVLDAIEVIRRNTYDAPEIRANVRLGDGYDVEICLVEPKEATLCPQ